MDAASSHLSGCLAQRLGGSLGNHLIHSCLLLGHILGRIRLGDEIIGHNPLIDCNIRLIVYHPLCHIIGAFYGCVIILYTALDLIIIQLSILKPLFLLGIGLIRLICIRQNVERPCGSQQKAQQMRRHSA